LLKGDDIDNKEEFLGRIKKYSGKYFNPQFVEALNKAADSNAFWIELSLPSINKLYPTA
jgi:response regulator RpfG family c-di-GMP phosphodiesterase